MSITELWVIGCDIVRQDIFMIRSLNRVGLGQYCEIGKVGLYFSLHTSQHQALQSPQGRSPALAPGERYSLPAVTAEMLTRILSTHQPIEAPVVCAF